MDHFSLVWFTCWMFDFTLTSYCWVAAAYIQNLGNTRYILLWESHAQVVLFLLSPTTCCAVGKIDVKEFLQNVQQWKPMMLIYFSLQIFWLISKFLKWPVRSGIVFSAFLEQNICYNFILVLCSASSYIRKILYF